MLYILISLIIVWYMIPHVLIYLYPIAQEQRSQAHKCWLRVTLVELVKLPIGILAPVIVPIALLFTKWEDNALPRLFAWWDNDISINGDPVDSQGRNAWALDYKENAYYAEAPPRSFWARYVWLGWRNRGSALSVKLGHYYKPGEFDSRKTLGNPAVSRANPGWKFVYTANICQLMIVKPIGSLCIRVNWGYKFFATMLTMPVGISFSILSRLK